ncbi:hypothetical protein ACIQXD_09990 [Streptomyces uncialis]|uniref:hypothetical protein n=1 Tax=Streptomyces uncialis TaxID=1048205 RepID=UPI0038250F8E
MATLEEIKALLGEPRFLWSDPEPWNLLEQELGLNPERADITISTRSEVLGLHLP